MKTRRKSHIVLSVLAVVAAAVLFVTYGTVLPAAPLAPIQLQGPTVVDSDGEFTVVVDSESRRALIMNADGDLTGVVSCTVADAPFDAITDACVRDGSMFLSGVRFAPDSDVIVQERVAVYDKGGNYGGVILERDGEGTNIPSIKSLNNVTGDIVIASASDPARALEESDSPPQAKTGETDKQEGDLVFQFLESGELRTVDSGGIVVHDVAYSTDNGGGYAILNIRGMLHKDNSPFGDRTFSGHVFTAVDIGDGVLYACDDETGCLSVISLGDSSVRTLVEGDGYDDVHENSGVVSLCDVEADTVLLCDASGAVTSKFTEVRPSIGFSARMMLVWASGLYLAVLVIVLAVRKVRRIVSTGKTESVGPMLLALAVVSAIAIAIGSLSYASYQESLELRAKEIDMCADYLKTCTPQLSEYMEKADNRDAIHGTDEELADFVVSLMTAFEPAFFLADSANANGIGMYCMLYGKDAKGVFYLFGSTSEYVMGTSARAVGGGDLEPVFAGDLSRGDAAQTGRTLRDTTLYRLVPIPTSDGKGVAGVIEIGSKLRSFESSIAGSLAQRILGLLVMVLAVYLAYSELRACGRCLFSYRQRRQVDAAGAVATLTRPFTLAITMLSSIDSVMTVLIARSMLSNAGVGDSSPLLALPAVMLGIGLVIGQILYAYAGRRVGLRRLVLCGAFVMLLCASLTGLAVASGVYSLYCVAKLAMSVPFGMLYSLGYSLPRLARDDDTVAMAAGGVRRTDTSAAALGTVLGGYAAQALGDVWVYALIALACLPVIIMGLNLLPRGMEPLEKLARSDGETGRMLDFVKAPALLALALFVVFPAALAAGYASFLFPLFSSDLGLSKSDVNNIFVLGQLVVYVCIGRIDHVEGRFGRWRTMMASIALLGAVFLLFSVNTTLAWSVIVVALVGLLCKSTDGWKALWLSSAGEAGIPAGSAVGAMFATRSLALVAQPFVMGALLGVADSIAVIIIGALCVLCAGLFYLTTRRTSLARKADA